MNFSKKCVQVEPGFAAYRWEITNIRNQQSFGGATWHSSLVDAAKECEEFFSELYKALNNKPKTTELVKTIIVSKRDGKFVCHASDSFWSSHKNPVKLEDIASR